MRILILSDRFHPEVTAPSVRILGHARVWIAEGHEVTVVTCAPNAPAGRLFAGYRNRLYQEESVEGVRVIRIWSYIAPNQGLVRRSLDYVSYMLSAIALCFRYPRFDVLVASSPPLLTALAGYAVATLKRRPWVFELRDLWPASIEAVGAARGRWLRALERLELFLYRRADRIVAVTEAFRRNLVSRSIPAEKIDVVRNGVDASHFDPRRARVDFRKEIGIEPDAFLAGYVGTTGMAHGLDTLLDAAGLCRDDPRLRFLILGEGAERRALEERARRLALANVTFHDFVPHDLMPSVLAALDASIVHLWPDPLFETVIPSKIFEAMASGTPLIHAVPGESARLVEEAGAGLCILSGDPGALAESVRKLAADASLCRRLGEAGRDAVQTQHGRESKARAMLESLRLACGGEGAPR